MYIANEEEEARNSDSRPFIVPVALALSKVELYANIQLTVNLQEGSISMEYCNAPSSKERNEPNKNQKNTSIALLSSDVEPIFSLSVKSTFDDVAVVRNYLQSLIEGKIKTFLVDELPLLVYQLSHSLIESILPENEKNTSPDNSLISASSFAGWSFDRDAFLGASYSTPEGLFLVERRLLSPLEHCIEVHRRVQESLGKKDEGSENKKNTRIASNGPVLMSFPFRSSMCHIMSSFNVSMLMHKYQDLMKKE